MNDCFLKALRRQPVERTPVWLMRQAGRYLPEYRKIRKKAGSFMQLCTTPELACEVSLQPLRRFDLDAAILFSDILTIPDAMGLSLHFVEGDGPRFEKVLRDEAAINQLSVPDLEEKLKFVMETIKLLKHELQNKLPLIGFSGSPWTLACYMVEGSGSRDFLNIKKMLYRSPALLQKLLAILAESVSLYLQAQIRAGVDAVMIFDTWGGILSTPAYQAFSLHYMQTIVQQLPKETPVILFTKNGGQWLEGIANTGCAAVGLDWTVDMTDAKTRIGDRVALQGNLDPAILFSTPEVIQQEVKRILLQAEGLPGHVFNLGHGVMQHTPPEHVQAMVEAVHG